MISPARILAAAAVLSLSACSAAPYYTPPSRADLPEGWRVAGVLKSTRVETRDADVSNEQWWRVFGDTRLDRLMEAALSGNQALRAAQARVDEADAQAGFAKGQLMPRIDATGSVTRGRSGPAKSDLDTVAQAGLQGSWDIDPAGGNRRRLEAALAEADAARAERDRIRAELVADTAIQYIRLAGARRQYALTQENLRAQSDSLQATEGQRAEGAISDLEVARARAQVAETRARLPALETQITVYTNRLAVLSGMQPQRLAPLLADVSRVPAAPQKAVIATPVATIAARPDIRVAERQLARDAALKEAASAQVFPSLSLAGFFGVADSRNVGGFNPWNLAASSLAPLINFGRIQRQIDAADAKQRQSFHQYQEAVLSALAEVEDALAAWINEQMRMESLAAAARSQGQARDIALEQFKAGAVDQLDLLIAEESRLNADIALAQSQTQVAENLALLYRAMGWGALAGAENEPMAPTGNQKMQPIADE